MHVFSIYFNQSLLITSTTPPSQVIVLPAWMSQWGGSVPSVRLTKICWYVMIDSWYWFIQGLTGETADLALATTIKAFETSRN